jgi:hypothetical protein
LPRRGALRQRRSCALSSKDATKEEFLSYHRDEDYKIVRLRDDLILATQYAFMMRRSGKLLEACEEYGGAPGVDIGAAYDPRPPRNRSPSGRRAKDWDIFTGEPL